jgi:hypothetical protein
MTDMPITASGLIVAYVCAHFRPDVLAVSFGFIACSLLGHLDFAGRLAAFEWIEF